MMHPLQFVKAMRDPQKFMQQITNDNQIMNNPMAKNAIEMYKNGNSQGLQDMAENLCKERGTSPQKVQDMLKNQFGI